MTRMTDMISIIGPDSSNFTAIVASVADNTYEDSIKAMDMGADIIELRIDLIEDPIPDDLIELIHRIKLDTGLQCIATNRIQTDGGKWNGSEQKRIELLENVAPYVDAIDIELSTDKTILSSAIEMTKDNNCTAIISYHNFSSTPDTARMDEIIDSAFSVGADIAKIAVTPGSKKDVLDLLQVTLNSQKPVCTISMGKIGKHTRVIAPFYGSVLTYGYVDSPTAPGQMRIDELRSTMEMIL